MVVHGNGLGREVQQYGIRYATEPGAAGAVLGELQRYGVVVRIKPAGPDTGQGIARVHTLGEWGPIP